MGQAAEAFMSARTLLVCLGVYVLTLAVRSAVEALAPKVKDSRFWNEVLLPMGPIVNGAFLGLIPDTFAWADIIAQEMPGQMTYGAVCGLLSAFLYGRVRSWFSSRGIQLPEKLPESLNDVLLTIPPPPPSVLPPGALPFEEAKTREFRSAMGSDRPPISMESEPPPEE